MKARLIVSMLVVAVAAAMVGGATFAWFTDEDSSAGSSFTAGYLTLDVDTGSEEFVLDLGEVADLAPGHVFDEVVIDIKNAGTLDLAWFGRFDIQGDLAGAVYIHKAQMEFFSGDGSEWESFDHFINDGRGHGVYGGYYEGLVDDDLDVITLNNFLADNHMGAGPGVQMGALKPGNYYRLTMQFGIAPLAGNKYQGKDATLSFKIVATQVNDDALAHLFANTDWLAGSSTALTEWLNKQLDKQ